MKVQKMIYLEPELNDRLRKLGRYQSELINAILRELLERMPEEEIARYRVKHEGFHGILSAAFADNDTSGKQAGGIYETGEKDESIRKEVQQLW